MKRVLTRMFLLTVTAGTTAGCWRDAPPDVPEFKAPTVRAVADTPEPAAEPSTPTVAEPPPAPPPAAPMPATRSQPAPAPAPAAALPPQAARKPTIVGTWDVVEMSQDGEVQPMSGMSVRFTFAPDGAVIAAMSGGPGGMSESKTGTYTVSGSAISINIENESRSGSLTFEGHDRAVLDVGETRMTLARVSG